MKIFNRKRVEELDRRFQIASSRNSVNSVRDIIKSKNLMREDISKEVEFLLNLSGKSDRDEVVELNSNGKLSDLSKRIIDIVDGNQRETSFLKVAPLTGLTRAKGRLILRFQNLLFPRFKGY